MGLVRNCRRLRSEGKHNNLVGTQNYMTSLACPTIHSTTLQAAAEQQLHARAASHTSVGA
jgi:hypothetical protein